MSAFSPCFYCYCSCPCCAKCSVVIEVLCAHFCLLFRFLSPEMLPCTCSNIFICLCIITSFFCDLKFSVIPLCCWCSGELLQAAQTWIEGSTKPLFLNIRIKKWMHVFLLQGHLYRHMCYVLSPVADIEISWFLNGTPMPYFKAEYNSYMVMLPHQLEGFIFGNR